MIKVINLFMYVISSLWELIKACSIGRSVGTIITFLARVIIVFTCIVTIEYHTGKVPVAILIFLVIWTLQPIISRIDSAIWNMRYSKTVRLKEE